MSEIFLPPFFLLLLKHPPHRPEFPTTCPREPTSSILCLLALLYFYSRDSLVSKNVFYTCHLILSVFAHFRVAHRGRAWVCAFHCYPHVPRQGCLVLPPIIWKITHFGHVCGGAREDWKCVQLRMSILDLVPQHSTLECSLPSSLPNQVSSFLPSSPGLSVRPLSPWVWLLTLMYLI